MKFRPRQVIAGGEETGKLPLTSLIDIIFLLLIFFMLTASFTPKESELSSALRAERAQGGRAADLQPQVVNVEREGGDGGAGGAVVYRMGGRVMRSQAELTELLRGLPKEQGVFVRVSPRVDVGAAAAALQAARDAGFRKVSYVPGR